MATPRLRADFQRGFTLIELVSIMLLIGILAFVALPRFDALDGYNAPAYRDRVKAVLQFARKAAVAQRRHVLVTTADNGLTLTIASADPDAGFPVGNFVRALTIPGTNGNTLLPLPGTLLRVNNADIGTLVFDAQGRPHAAAGAPLAAATGYSVAGLAISVEAESGYVH